MSATDNGIHSALASLTLKFSGLLRLPDEPLHEAA